MTEWVCLWVCVLVNKLCASEWHCGANVLQLRYIPRFGPKSNHMEWRCRFVAYLGSTFQGSISLPSPLCGNKVPQILASAHIISAAAFPPRSILVATAGRNWQLQVATATTPTMATVCCNCNCNCNCKCNCNGHIPLRSSAALFQLGKCKCSKALIDWRLPSGLPHPRQIFYDCSCSFDLTPISCKLYNKRPE